MPRLPDLPNELVDQILEEIGGRELRRGRGAARLSLNRKWYVSARPVYLSGLDITDIVVHVLSLSELETKFAKNGNRQLMHKNTRQLGFRLSGYAWTPVNRSSYNDMVDWRDNVLRPRLEEFSEICAISLL